MKKIKGFGITSIFVLASIFVNAQTENTSFIVSKGVQFVANKKAFEDENVQKSHIQVKSMLFPAIVISKGIVQPSGLPANGNIVSKEYPTWTISKGVARKNMEQNRKKAESKKYPSEDIRDKREISKR